MISKTKIRKMSIKKGKFIKINNSTEKDFAFCIEDPICINFNPGYSVLINRDSYKRTIYEFQRAYQALTANNFSFFNMSCN